MKKSLLFAGLAAATLSITGCNKEVDFFGQGKAFEVVLNTEDTRTVNNGMQTSWVNNDQLNAFYAPAGSTTWSNNIKFTVQDAATNQATGTVEGLTEDSYDWYFLYPYSSYVVSPTGLKPDGTPAGYMTVGSSASGSQQQTGYDSMAHLAGANLPIYGVVKDVPVSEKPVVAMKQIASVVKVNVKNMTSAAIQVLGVAVTAPVDIVGTYYLDLTGTTPAFTPSGETYVSKTASLTVQEYTDLAAGATATFYIAVKPFTAAAGTDISVKVTGSNGEQTSTKTLVADAVFAPGKIKEVNVNYDKAAVVSEYEWVKKTLDSVTEEDVFVIVGNNGANYAMSNDKGTSAAPTAVAIAIENDKLKLEPAANLLWKVIKNRSASVKFSPADKDDVFLYTTNTNNGVRVGAGEHNTFTEDQGYLKNDGTSRYVGIYNSSDWRCYETINNNIKNQTFAYYVKYATGTGTPDKVFTAELEGALDGENLEVPASTVSATIHITADADVAWTAQPSEGLTLSATSGTGTATVTASFAANTSTTPKAYSVMVSSETPGVANDEFELTITQLGVSTTAKEYPYEESFATDQGDFTIDNVSLDEGLSYVWSHGTYNGSGYMKANAYVSSTYHPSVSWLVSPVVDMTGATAPELSFSHCINKFFGDVTQEATVWIRQEGGEWAQLTISYPTEFSGNFTSFKDIKVDVSSYAGKKVQVGFKYVSTSEHAGVWEVKNFKLAEVASGPVDPTFTVPETLTVEEGATAKINVTTNTDGTVSFTSANTAVATVAADGTVTGVAAGSTTITVAAAATENFNPASRTVAVTVTAAQTGDYYGKVSTITSGKKYLVAGGGQPKVLGNTLSNGKIAGVAVTITDGKIAANATTNAYAVTITVNNEGKYSIALPNGKYLIYNSSTNLKASDTATDTWTVSEGVQGVFRFTSTETDSRALAYRAGSQNNFGGYAVSNLTATSQEYFDIDLYELGAEPTVVPSAATLSSISVSGQQTAFNLGDAFTFGGTVTATYSDGSTKDVTSSARIAEPDMTTAGTKNVTVSYTEDEVTRSVTYEITITDPNPGTGGEKVIIIDGSQLTSTATTQATDKTYGGVTITFSDGAKYQTSNGENKFADKAILIGKSGKYIYNKTAIPGKITKFEVYSNLGASKKVSIGINFSESAISAYNANASNTYTATLETEDCIYDCSDKLPANARYFWYQVTNANNSQIQFRITYE